MSLPATVARLKQLHAPPFVDGAARAVQLSHGRPSGAQPGLRRSLEVPA